MKKRRNQPCPCGSRLSITACCLPILSDQSLATTAEKLMRSRYCGFVLKNSTYILASWHRKTRPKTLKRQSRNYSCYPTGISALEVSLTF